MNRLPGEKDGGQTNGGGKVFHKQNFDFFLAFHIFWLLFWAQPNSQVPAFNAMTIHARRQTNVSKQTTLLDGIHVGSPEQRQCWRGLNRYVHEAMNNISNVKVHFKTRI